MEKQAIVILQHTKDEVAAILTALRKSFPMEVVEDLVMKIRMQAMPQIQAAEKPADPAPEQPVDATPAEAQPEQPVQA